MLILATLALLVFQDASPKLVPPVCEADDVQTEDCLRPLEISDDATAKPGSDAAYGFQNYPRDEAIMDAVNAQRDADLGGLETPPAQPSSAEDEG